MSFAFGQPTLIEPVTVVIESINKLQTPYSAGVSGKREIINHVVRDQFQIPAQVVFNNFEQIQHLSNLGVDEQARGYIVVRPIDLKAQGKEIKRGDRIVKVQGMMLSQVLYFIHSVGDLSAHFSNVGFTFVRMWFTDRDPVG